MVRSLLPLPAANSPNEGDRLRSCGLSLPRVEMVSRTGSVLHASPWDEHGDVLSLNLTRGCAHRCTFCSVRSSQSYQGDDAVGLYANTARRLDMELSARRTLPRAIFVSPATDPFPPLAPVQAETARVVEVLARHGIDVWLMTRGFIRPSVLEVLAAHANRVKVTIGLTTLDRSLRRALEPLAAPTRLRVRQLAQLHQFGISVQAAIQPLVPGVTDSQEHLKPLLQAIAVAGIRHITTSYVFVRSNFEEGLLRTLEPFGYSESVRAAFRGGPILSSGNLAPARYLPKQRRQRGYAALMALASLYDINVRVCSLTNPDFRNSSAAPPVHHPRQLPLALAVS